MRYKEDWEEAKPRLAAWWEGEVLDRLALAVMSPRSQPIEVIPEVKPPEDLIDRWLNTEYRIYRAENSFVKTFFGGEAFPYFDTHIGPGSFALFLGSEPGFAEDTVWYNPCLSDPKDYAQIAYDPENRWWQVQRSLIAQGVERSQGRYLVGMPDLVENLDTVASLRGTTQALLDLPDRPEFVHALQRHILPLWYRYFDELYKLIKDETSGNSFSAFRIWAPGRMAKVQCDFSAMISPDMFEEFVVPYLSEQCDWLDYSVFHLDGPDCVCHLDLLLDIPGLNAIQWTPGAGQPGTGSLQWIPLYKRILAGGKSLLLLGAASDLIEPLVEEIGIEGVFIVTNTASEQDAKELLKRARGWK